MHPDEKKHYEEEAMCASEERVNEGDLYDAFAFALRQAAKFCEQEARRASKRERVRRCTERLNEAVKDLHANG